MRHRPRLAAAALAALLSTCTGAASAQSGASAAHRLPSGSVCNVLELAVGGAGDPAGGLAVVVAEAPPWLAFEAVRAPAVRPDEDGTPSGVRSELVARLAFRVASSAPAGEAAEVVLQVVDASGAVAAVHSLRVVAEAPAALALAPPRPNPSAGAVAVAYAVPEDGRIRLAVYDALGREVLTLADEEARAGGHEARIEAGRLAAGTYAIRLVAGRDARVVRLTVVR